MHNSGLVVLGKVEGIQDSLDISTVVLSRLDRIIYVAEAEKWFLRNPVFGETSALTAQILAAITVHTMCSTTKHHLLYNADIF